MRVAPSPGIRSRSAAVCQCSAGGISGVGSPAPPSQPSPADTTGALTDLSANPLEEAFATSTGLVDAVQQDEAEVRNKDRGGYSIQCQPVEPGRRGVACPCGEGHAAACGCVAQASCGWWGWIQLGRME